MILEDYWNAWEHPSIAHILKTRWLVGPIYREVIFPLLCEGGAPSKEEIVSRLLAGVERLGIVWFRADKPEVPEQPVSTRSHAERMATALQEYLLRLSLCNGNGSNGSGKKVRQ
jgi:hypothetical protein